MTIRDNAPRERAVRAGGAITVSERRTTHIKIDFGKILDVMGVGVRRSSTFMSLGLKVARDTSLGDANLEEEFQFRFFPESVSQQTIGEIRTNFGEWVLGNALKELDQHFSLLLDAINEVMTLSAHCDKWRIKSRASECHSRKSRLRSLAGIHDGADAGKVGASLKDNLGDFLARPVTETRQRLHSEGRSGR